MNYIVYGADTHLLQKQVQEILKEFLKEDVEMNTTIYDAMETSMAQIIDDASTIPFFSEKKAIVVQRSLFLTGSKEPSVAQETILPYLSHSLSSTLLIFVVEHEKLDTRKKIVKEMMKHCRCIETKVLDEQGKIRYVRESVRKMQLNIKEDAVLELIERLPLQTQTIEKEMEKLQLYGDEIDVSLIRCIITRPLENDVFQLVHAVVDKDIKKAFSIWRDLCVLNKEPIQIIGALAAQFRFLYEIKVLQMQGVRNKNELASRLKVSSGRVYYALQSAQKLKLETIHAQLRALAELDQKMKSGKIDKKIGFELYLLGVR